MTVLSGVGAITVSMPKAEYEYARGDNITLPCTIQTSGDLKGGVITWYAEGIEDNPKEVRLPQCVYVNICTVCACVHVSLLSIQHNHNNISLPLYSE